MILKVKQFICRILRHKWTEWEEYPEAYGDEGYNERRCFICGKVQQKEW